MNAPVVSLRMKELTLLVLVEAIDGTAEAFELAQLQVQDNVAGISVVDEEKIWP